MGRILNKVEDISFEQRKYLINEWVFHERNRNIAKRKLIDGITYEKIAEEYDICLSQAKNIVRDVIDIMCEKI